MGTTAEKLAYLNDTKAAIRDAIVAKGVDVPDGTPFRQYAEKVREIETGISLLNIEITKQPDKTTYLPNERFDPSGMEVTATYENGATLIATGYSWTPDGNLAEGTTEITVRYTEGGVTATATVSISVKNPIYGVMWDRDNSSTKLTRLTADNDPNGIVNTSITEEPVSAVGSIGGRSPFDTLYPWSEMTEWNIVDGVAKYKKGDSGFSRTQYDTMVYIPEFWVKVVDGTNRCYYIATAETDGFTKHPGSGQYISRYHAGNWYVSKSGLAPLANITRATARTGARNKGTGWNQVGFDTEMAWRMLYLVEYADWDSQSAIGRGYVDGNFSAINSGATDTMAYHTGRVSGTDGKTAVQYRGIENPWGNVSTWCDGINFNERRTWICLNPDQWADDTESNYTDTGVTISTYGWIKDLGFSSTFTWALIPGASGGSDSTYIPDYVNSSAKWRTLNLGGYFGYGSHVGVLAFSGDSTSSAPNNSTGARLRFTPQ